MAFGVTATVGSDSINLHDGAPFSIQSIRGAGGVNIRRVTIQGPTQDGDTDRGYRLGTRDLELVVIFKATDDATLDGYRDTLTSFFKPLTHTPVKLRITRDDAAVRQVDCYARGTSPVDIRLVPELRPGHTHRATISLRATDSPWYNPTGGSISVVGTSLTAAQWWLAGNAIGSAQVVEHGTAPTQGQVWTYAGTPSMDNDSPAAGGYTIAFRSGQESIATAKYAFYAGDLDGTPSISFSTGGTIAGYPYAVGVDHVGANYPGIFAGSSFMPAGTHNYFVFFVLRGIPNSGKPHYVSAYRNSVYDLDNEMPGIHFGTLTEYALSGTARRWRSNGANDASSRWTEALTRYAVYVPALTFSQMEVLNTYMSLPDDTADAQTLPISYAGNLPEYPIISISGPVSRPSVTNLSTGHTLDFGTIVIGAGTTYVINTNPQHRTVLAGTVNKRGELTADSDLSEFNLSPHVTGGTNVLYLNGTAMGEATAFTVTWNDRYSSF